VLDGTPEQTRRLASAGREAVDAEVRIVDDQGHDLPPGRVGENLMRGPSVISGYWQARKPKAAIRDGWFVTGDLGYLDQKRYLFLVDRKKDMVVSGGVNIYTKKSKRRCSSIRRARSRCHRPTMSGAKSLSRRWCGARPCR
jgi:long-chain acyl-CoA synthetase